MDNDISNVNSVEVNNRMSSEREFEEAFRFYYRPLFLFAYGYVMDEEEAENVVQAVFMEMWEKRKNFPENCIEMGIYPTLEIGGGEDYTRDKYNIPWTSTPIEGVDGAPIYVTIKSVVSYDGNPEIFERCG